MSVKIEHDKGLDRFDWFVVVQGRVVAGGQERTRQAAREAGKRAENRVMKRKSKTGGRR